MGSIVAELGLDLKLFADRAVDGFLRESAAIAGDEDRAAKLVECLKGLEQERTKIEAFKRDLPFSIHIVTAVIKILKEKTEECRSDGEVEKFIPVKSNLLEEDNEKAKLENDSRDKMNWMSSAQLWNDSSSENKNNESKKKNIVEENENPSFEYKNRSCRGAFMPFKGVSDSPKEEKAGFALPDLSLLSAGVKAPVVADEVRFSGLSPKGAGRILPCSSARGHLSLHGQQDPLKKARRCWSPELHRRFILALQQLGGPQVATPKQIRELMKVDGLTNDEVKSHLQKYRLHTRRAPNASSQNRSVAASLWVPQDRYAASQQSASQSGSPQGPLQLVGSARDSCEEDDKSESCNWK